MKPGFWHERWRRNEIGFHQREINAHLQPTITVQGRFRQKGLSALAEQVYLLQRQETQ